MYYILLIILLLASVPIIERGETKSHTIIYSFALGLILFCIFYFFANKSELAGALNGLLLIGGLIYIIFGMFIHLYSLVKINKDETSLEREENNSSARKLNCRKVGRFILMLGIVLLIVLAIKIILYLNIHRVH